MRVDRAEFPITVRHTVCGRVAMYRRPGRQLFARMVAFPDGSQPQSSDRMRCYSCGLIARDRELSSEWPGRCVYCAAPAPPGQKHCPTCIMIAEAGL